MRGFFEANSVAVIGVSERPDNLARSIVNNLQQQDYKGIIYLVGARGGVAFGRRIYHRVEDIPDTVDLAVILTPAATVPDLVEACGRKSIRRVIIESAGFGELGPEGDALQQRLLEAAARHDIRFIGPNGIGVMNFHNGLVVPFAPLGSGYPVGKISIVAQSGGVGISYLHLLASEGLGVSKVVSMGNKLDVDENDLLTYLLEDPDTDIICLYLEGISDGPRLMDIARRATKPILLHKSNIGRLSRSIAASHTAALANDDQVVDAALRQVGIVRFRDSETLLDYLKVLPMPRIQGNRLAVVSRSGGHAVIAADACERAGFDLAPFPDAFVQEVERHFRAHVIRLTNPLDLGDLFDLDIYARIARETLALPEVDGLVFLHTYVSRTEGEAAHALFRTLAALPEAYGKPVVTCVATDAEELSRVRREYGLPVFSDPQDAVNALALARDFQHDREVGVPAPPDLSDVDPEPVRAILAQCRAESRDPLLLEALEILAAYRIPVIPSTPVADAEAAVAAAERLGYPVTLKVVSPHISHKSDFGGVQLNLRNAEAVRTAFAEMMETVHSQAPEAVLRGALVQPMAPPAFELIVGGKQDPTFGPVVLLGLGGIFAEVFQDVSRRVVPIAREEAERMVDELRAAPVLRGARGQRPRDVAAVADVLLRLSRLLLDFPEVSEIDINPLRVRHEGHGGLALDARILLSHPDRP